MTIKKATLADLEEIMSLWHELTTYKVNLEPYLTLAKDHIQTAREYLSGKLLDPDTIILLALKDGRAVGYLMGFLIFPPPVFTPRKIGFINEVAVAEEFRRQGIGTRLVEEALAWFRERGATSLELSVYAKNQVAKEFWHKLGFTEIRAGLAREI